MNKGTLRTIMYIALGVLIFSVVINLFFSILPYLLIGGAVIYVVTKVVGYFNSKKSKNSSNESTNNNYEVYVDDSVDTSNAIDVDFEDVKDKVYAITPVPGGIGPMTITMLLHNTLEAFYHHQGE